MSLKLPSAAELSLNVMIRAPRLVLDPGLCLSPTGPLLVERLQSHAELWLPRELWRILDNSDYFSLRPDALAGGGLSLDAPAFELALRHELSSRLRASGSAETESVPDPEQLVNTDLARTLEAWEAIRSSTDLLGLRLFWLGDGLAESLLAPGCAEDLHARFEALAERLDSLLASSSPLACGRRDALALSLALGGVPILCALEAASETPGLCGLTPSFETTEIGEADPWAALEREQFRSAFVRAQCVSLPWSALSLAIVHLHAPQASAVRSRQLSERAAGPACSFERARFFWYRL